MNAFRLAFAFIRVPKLFVSLLLWPLILTLLIVLIQGFLSASYFVFLKHDAETAEERWSQIQEHYWLRKLIFGSDEALPALQVCRWDLRNGREQPLAVDCPLKEYDVVLQVADPLTFSARSYEEMFSGATRTLHVCRHCRGNVTIFDADHAPRTEIYNPFAFGVLALVEATNVRVRELFLTGIQKRDEQEKLRGSVLLFAPGLPREIQLSEFGVRAGIILNFTGIVMLALWLALRAHRRVLEYFAQNDALLPLVAACGKETFYSSLWIITIIRVACFLFASIPLMYLMIASSLSETKPTFGAASVDDITLWLISLICSFSAITIISSIGELKHRHTAVSFLYQYVPLAAALLGMFVLALAVLDGSTFTYCARLITTALPVVGTPAIIAAPMLPAENWLIFTHAALSLLAAYGVLRMNSRWFAAHLEQL